MNAKKNIKQLHSLINIDKELQKCFIIIHRLRLSFNKYIYLTENMPATVNGYMVDKIWNKNHRVAKAKLDVDIHALMVHSYHLLNLILNNKYLKNDVTEEKKELINIMRHHYEHWNDMKFYYQNNEKNQFLPPSGSNVEKYFKKYRTPAKESPVGYFSIGKFINGKFVRNITIGGAMNLSDMNHFFKKLEKKTTTLIKEYREKLQKT